MKDERANTLGEKPLKQRDLQGGAALSRHQVFDHVHVCQLQAPVVSSCKEAKEGPEELGCYSKESGQGGGLQLQEL